MKIAAIGLAGLGIVCAGVWAVALVVKNNPPVATLVVSSPVPTTQATGSGSGTAFDETSKETCGDPPDASATWYAVFIDGGNLNEVHRRFCKDAIAVNRQDSGKASIQVASFTDRARAEVFARSVSGEVSRYEPHQAGREATVGAPSGYSQESLNAVFLEVQDKIPGFPDTPAFRKMVENVSVTYCESRKKGVSENEFLRASLRTINRTDSTSEVKMMSSGLVGAIIYAAKTHLCL